jgi:hypothetical protein
MSGATMTPFDPFTATAADAQAQPDANGPSGAVWRWGGAQDLIRRRDHYEANPLEGMDVCAVHAIAAPEWLARAYLRCYRKVTRYEVRSWDEAFGAPFKPRADLAIGKLRRLKVWELAAFFERDGAPPRTKDGFRIAAQALGITPRQAEEWTPKTRKNTRGHKPYGWRRDSPGGAANDPFGLTQKPG